MVHANLPKPHSARPGWIAGLWRFFRQPSAKISLGLLVGAGFVGGIMFWAAFNVGLEMTNNESFCRTCHEMDDNVYREYRTSVHDQNRTGVRATCPDCHVPHEFLPKMWRKLQASNEVLHKLLGTINTREKFEEHRLELARHEWSRMKDSDSHACRSCHNFDQMDLTRQNSRARLRHSQVVDEGKTCIDCHKGIAHRLPAGALEAEKDFNDTWDAAHPHAAASPSDKSHGG
jgi:cytochrome c-type protein NapC